MKILVLSSHTPSLFWFRMEMMKTFLGLGHTVIAAAQESELVWAERFREQGIEYRQVFVQRNGVNPLSDLKTLRELNSLMKEVKPDKVFVYQAKTIIYGALAAAHNNIGEVYPLVAGLGSIFRGKGRKNKLLTEIVSIQYRLAFRRSRKVIFQNDDDMNNLLGRKLLKKTQIEKINGSGVNLDKFLPAALPEEPAFLLIARLIRDKGVMEYLEACKMLKSKYKNIRCMLVGPFDTNPSALKPEELDTFIAEGIIEYNGEQKDVRPYIEMCSTYVLPSYHEGTPKTVLEAMAMGRAIITTHAPGCKETVVDGENGYLVDVKNVNQLVEKMEYLINNPDINRHMGIKSIKLVQEKFDVKKINAEILRIMGLEESYKVTKLQSYKKIVISNQ